MSQPNRRMGNLLASVPFLALGCAFAVIYWPIALALTAGAFASNPILGVFVFLMAVGIYRRMNIL